MNTENLTERRVKFLRRASTLLTWIAIPLLSACASAPAVAPPEYVQSETARHPYQGPKKTIAVATFDANGAFLARYGDWQVGDGLAAQLATALSKSDRFVLVERAGLDAVLEEQELGLRGLTTRTSAPRAGALVGAQLLIRGSVTEFNERDEGGGFSIGGPITNSFAGAISPRRQTGHVAIDFRVIDTTTGRVVATHTSRAKISRRSIAFSGTGSDLNFSADAFQRSSLGEATRDAIHDAVAYVEYALADVPWSAHVAQVRGNQVYLTAGANANLSPGTSLIVYQVAERIVDPTTGEVLGTEEVEVGTLLLEHVESRYARGTFIGSTVPRTGDLVRFEPGRRISGLQPRY